MISKLLVIACLLATSMFCAIGQNIDAITEQIIADIYEQISENSEEEIDFTSFFDDLYVFTQEPINLNATNKETLEQLQFLSDHQIENILYYVYKYGKIQTIYELQLIEGLAAYEIRNLLPFVYLGEKSEKQELYWREILKYGRSQLLFRLDRGVETKEGYKFYTQENEQDDAIKQKKYLGDPFYTSLRYRFNFRNKIQFGLSAEKDAGEQFWGTHNKGYDFYAGYLQANDFWKFKTIVVGDFRASFGQGLVLRPELGFGKSAYVLNVSTRNAGLKKYTSTDEYNFFRGTGATIRLGKFDVSAFYSNKMIDANGLSNGTFTGIYKSGLHRTQNEWLKKHTINQQVLGGNATFTYQNLQIGITAVNTILSDTLVPSSAAYNTNYFSGTKQFTSGLHYRFKVGKLNIFGETALTNHLGVATLNGISATPISQVSLVILYRYYSPMFDNFYATAFSENSRINNESGLYLGAEVRPFRKWKFSVYADGYYFTYLSYGIDKPSAGFDYLLQTDFALNRNINMYWRFKVKQKSTNTSGTNSITPCVQEIDKTSFRYYLTYNFGQFYFKNILELNFAQKEDYDLTYGILLLQDIGYRLQKIPITLDVRFQVFDAQNYENRFYSYEKDVLYAFSIPMYYGLGARYYFNIKYDINRHLAFWFKIAQSVYADDRETISSSYEEIEGNRKTDIRVMIRWKF